MTINIDSALKSIDMMCVVVDNTVVQTLCEVGEYVVGQIRNGNMSNWTDDTGNLRSSIGYAVAKDGGIVMESSFQTVSGGNEGSEQGRKLAGSIAGGYPSGYVLVIVAGMEYAVYVEAMSNKVVLSHGWLYLRKNIADILKDRIERALKAI